MDVIKLEPIGGESAGAEFVLTRGDEQEFHQVKRRGAGRWSLSALRAEGVLAEFSAELQSGGAVHFVSEQDANELRVLAERARNARDLSDFLVHLGGDTRTQQFRTLSDYMSLSEADAFSALRRITVTVIDEQRLTSLNEAWAEPLIGGRPADVLADLADLVRNSVPGCLQARDVWDRLNDTYGKERRTWALDADLHELVDTLTETYLAPLRAVRLEPPIDRVQVGETLALLRDADPDGVLLTGSAGSGKSDLLVETITALRQDGWAVLCLRADRLEPTPTAGGIGDQLGLPGSPVGVLAAVGGPRPSLLVIDQLDAVSLASGRVTGLWEALYALICQAPATPRMRVLIACRQFDVDNDHRMRALTSEQHELSVLSLPPLEPNQVDRAVSAMGLNPATLTDRKRSLLAVPLHLILLQAVSGEESDALDFTTITDLFARFWRTKQRDADQHAGRAVRWFDVIRAATRYMSEHRRLSVPAGQLDATGLLADADILESEHVLVRDRGTYRFFHEAFFDYAFAHLYLANGGTVGGLLVGDEQDLFRRAQVRQLLAQQRDTDFLAYLRDLAELLNGEHIRFHIKQLTLEWLTAMAEPQSGEVEVLARILDDSDPGDPRRPLVWRVFAQSAWFDVAVDAGLAEKWLTDPDPTATNVFVQVLSTLVNERTDTVLELLRRYDDRGEVWRDRIAHVVRFSDVQNSRGLFDMLLDALDRDAYNASADHDAWLAGHELPQAQPEWAGELLTALLARASAIARADGHQHALYDASPLQHEYTALEFLTTLADTDPGVLVTVALPFMLEVIDSALEPVDGQGETAEHLPVDRVWPYRLADDAYTFNDTLLASVRGALGKLSATQPDECLAWAEQLRVRRDETSQYLLYYGLLGNPLEFADLTADILLDGAWRYRTEEKGEGYWLVNQLLEAIAPHLLQARICELEAAVLYYTPGFELTVPGHRRRGRTELWLLSGLASGAISEDARRRLAELERKFPHEKPEPPPGIIAGIVTSPITTEQARKFSDADWLRAIDKHRERWEDKRSMDLVGGADQFANVLQQLTQEQPERFARLGLDMPEDTLDTYFEHLLIGLYQTGAEATRASLDSIVALSRRFAGWARLPGARWLPRLIAGYTEEPIPDDLLALVARIATEDPDPREDVWKVRPDGGEAYYGGDIHGAGMNSTRGSAAEAIAQLIGDESRVDLLAPVIARLAADPIASVKACAAQAVYALMRWRREAAIDDLQALVDGPDRLLATNTMQQLIMAAISTHWTRVRRIIERMLASDEEDVREAGGALASVAGLEETDAQDLLSLAIDGQDPRVRRGVAKVLAARAVSSRYSERCADGLRRLFEDSDAEVRAESAKVFWRVHDRELGELQDISRDFLSSAAFDGNHQHFLRALQVSSADVSDLVLATAERMVTSNRAGLGDVRGRVGGDSRVLSDLLLRVLGTLDIDRERINRALDILDLMLEAGAWGVTEALETADR